MSQPHRAQILMDPAEYQRLTEIAEVKHVSVAELFRAAVRAVYLTSPDDRRAAAERIVQMNLPVDEWAQMKADIEAGYDADLP